MNTPNPLVPQGILPDNRGKSHVRIAVFTILAIHVLLLGGLLLQGCKRTTPDEVKAETTNGSLSSLPPWTPPPLPPLETTPPPPVDATPLIPPPATAPPSITVVTPEPTLPPPVVEPPVRPAPVLTRTEHVVVKGDTFSGLAKKYGVSVRAIAEANPGVDSSRLKIGQKLLIPPPSAPASSALNGMATGSGGEKIYTVKSGDTLMKVAKMHGTTVKALRAANRLRTDQIKVGQKLKIPSKTAPPALEPLPDVPGTLPPSP